MTCMTLVLLGNYAQTGHFGGPTAYTPFNVATHLAGPASGGLRFDYRRQKHPYSDKFMLAAGHCAPDLLRPVDDHGRGALPAARGHGRPPLSRGARRGDALGRRARLPARRRGASRPCWRTRGSPIIPLFAQAKGRGIRSLSGHIESTDVTNDVNGGPSGIGIATAAGKAAFWDFIGAPPGSPKVDRLRGRVRDVRGPRSGAEDPSHRPSGRQAPPDLLLRQQRRHRRRADRRRGEPEVRRLPPAATSGRPTAGTSSPSPTGTTTTRSSGCCGRWRSGTPAIAGP